MDIKSGSGWPSSSLSNFAGHRFELDGVQCNSMEGFLQGLKYSNPEMQQHVCTLVGKAAKLKGRGKNWKRSGQLHWQGHSFSRFSDEYQTLLNRAYNALYEQSEAFRKALAATNGRITHSIGKRKPQDTVLTEKEFCSRLMKLRDDGVIDW